MAREMRHSGIEWIGEIPKEWKVLPHKYIMHKKKEIQEHYSGQDIISLTMNGVIVRDLDAGGKMPLSFDGYQVVYPNNLLLCLFDIDVTPRCVGLIKNYGVTSPAYSQFVVKDGSYPPYYDYLLRYMDDNKCLLHLSKNLRSSLTETDFGQIHTCLPPLVEQQKIANYLDTVCGEVDEMIALQEQMIEELKAYKQSVITEAVTKGLNLDVPMKDSGIDWIGEVPEHWGVKRLKEIFVLQTGTTPKDYEKGLDTDVLVNWFTPSDVGEMNCELESSQRYLSKVVVEKEGINLYPKGSLIFVAIGASAGKIGYANIEGYSNQQITALIPKENCYSKYSYYYMIADRKRIRENAFFTTLPIINNGYLSSVRTLLPPIEEQQSIASYLDTKCAEIDALIAIKQAKIDELKDYKKSVIYEYVTGKKEVV